MSRRQGTVLAGFLGAIGFVLLGSQAVRAAECENGSFSSTYDLIQAAIFENRGCSDTLCHGSGMAGGLDLRKEASYQSLVDVDALTVLGMKRVATGDKDKSLLWLNLAAKTQPSEFHAPLRPMPLDPLPALTANELEAVRSWIEAGAPRDGVVQGTDQLLNACLPPPEPLSIKPLPPPAPGVGVQVHMPQWVLQPHSEHEVCYASYYDVTDQVPQEFRDPTGQFLRYKRAEIRQDPLSHHLIVNQYNGKAPANSPAWGVFRCRGGARDGVTCNPLDRDFCGADSGCATDSVVSPGCINFGPADSESGINSNGVFGTQQAEDEQVFVDGVYTELPLKGVFIWNSHAFNLTDKAGKLEGWMNFYFAPPEEQRIPRHGIFDTSAIFKMNAPAFGTDEVCNIFEIDPNAHLYELSSHMHKRGKRFRTFLGAWRCRGGSKNNAACSPFGPDMVSTDICDGAPCVSLAPAHVGDCDHDGAVTIDEVVTCVNIALGTAALDACTDADSGHDGSITIDELIPSVSAALNGVPPPAPRDAPASQLYESRIYNDPVMKRFDPPMVFPDAEAAADERSLTFCALYDNGYTNPDEVKMRSTSPPPPLPLPGFGGPCLKPTNCTSGKMEAACSGANEAARNASCDTSPGAGDGFCDACPLHGGVTTEDEMFVLLGQYFVP